MSAEIIRGTYVEVPFALTDVNGAAVDLSVAGRSLVLRMIKDGGTVVTLTRTTGVAGEYSWTSQSGGTGKFIFSIATTLAAALGKYTVEVYYIATAETKEHKVFGPVFWFIKDASSGALP